MSSKFPKITISGQAYERGKQYGEAAKDKIAINLDVYAQIFQAFAGLSWEEAKQKASLFESSIADFMPDALEEMRGIADGGKFNYEDILTLNCRSELMFALPDGCSTMAFTPEMTGGKTILSQTWDWMQECRAATVILEIHQNPLPTILIAAEAGMIGGKGINSSGLGFCVNANSVGYGQIGVPFHVLFRAILNSNTVSNALGKLTSCKRACAGTYTIGSSSGAIISFEFTPDKFDVLLPEKEPICHTNHYLSSYIQPDDTLKANLPCTYVRYNMLRRQVIQHKGDFTLESIYKMYTNHVNYPDSICNHQDPEDEPMKRLCTIYGLMLDLNTKTLWISNSNPCEGPAYPFCLIP